MKIASFSGICRMFIWSSCIPVLMTAGSSEMKAQVDDAVSKCRLYMQAAFTCWPPKRKINKYSYRLRQLFLNSVYHFSAGKCAENNGRYRRADKISTSVESPTMQTMTRHSMPEIARGDRNNIDRSLFGLGLDGMMDGNRMDFGFGAFQDRGELVGFADFVEPAAPAKEDAIEGERGQLQFTDRIIGEERKQFFKLERECEKASKFLLENRKLQNCPRINKWKQRLSHLLTDLTKMKNVCMKKEVEKTY